MEQHTEQIPKYTLVICSCDAYQDAWMPLFTLLDRYWQGIRQIPIVLNTETLTYKYEGMNILCPQLYASTPRPQSVPWSRRLRETIKQAVHTEQVLIFFDDYFLRSPVDTERLKICSDFMAANSNVGFITLFPIVPPYTPEPDYPWLVKRPKNAPYILNFQVGLWRKDRLIHFLRNHESPWYFERWGSLRARRYPDDFYAALAVDGRHLMFDYLASKEGLSGGMWFPDTQKLFDKENINLDLSIRGIIPEGWKAPVRRRNWFKTAWNIFLSLRP